MTVLPAVQPGTAEAIALLTDQILDDLRLSAKWGTVHPDIIGLCTAIGLMLSGETHETAESIFDACRTTYTELRNGTADEHGYGVLELFKRNLPEYLDQIMFPDAAAVL